MLVFDAYLTQEEIDAYDFALDDENWPMVFITRPDLITGIEEAIMDDGARVVFIWIEGSEEPFVSINPISDIVQAYQKHNNVMTTLTWFGKDLEERTN